MQLQLDLLNEYVNSIKMKINLGKTKIMVVRKYKSRGQAENIWEVGNNEIEECDSYKYLGVIFKSNGSFSGHAEKN